MIPPINGRLGGVSKEWFSITLPPQPPIEEENVELTDKW